MLNKACIVGAGPGGLALMRSFMRHDIDFDCFERHSDVGGIWDQDNPGSPIYDSAHFISSKTQSHYIDFPMPDSYPDYPSHGQILAYMRSFAKAYNLYPRISFNIEVTSTEKLDDGWRVKLSNGETRDYQELICVSGTNWQPNIPEFKGEFEGEIRHSVTYRGLEEFKHKRVLVVGAGNSGCDIACDAAQMAKSAFISLRRGYHFIPKHLFGQPADVIAHAGPKMPMWLSQWVFGGLLKILNGDLTRLGLPKPDHKVFETHPILNSQLLHFLSHGDIKAKADIDYLDGKCVVFKDGTREEIDLILLATGYRWQLNYIDTEFFDWRSGRPDLYMNLFSRKAPGLYALGFMETNGGAYKLFDQMADLISQAITGRRDQSMISDQFQGLIETDRPDLSGGVKFVESARHATYVEIDAYQAYMAKLRKRLGWADVQTGDFRSLQV